jgi:hypothetical protein
MTTVTISANATINESNVIINEETIKVISNDKFKDKITVHTLEPGKKERVFSYSELVNGYLCGGDRFISFISKRWVYFISAGGKLFYFYNKAEKKETNDKINVIKFDSVDKIYCNNKQMTGRYLDPIYPFFGDPAPTSEKDLLAVINTLVSTPTI